MKLLRRLFHPFFAFLAVQLAWVLVVIVWLYWFLGRHRQLRALAEKYSPELLQQGADWFILAEGLVLLVAILAGVYVIFVYWSRQATLLKTQKNFIAQVSHELKSPLASLQLHLETVRRHRPPPEKMDVFLDTMLADTDRLEALIDKLITAGRLEKKDLKLDLQEGDLSRFVEGYFRDRQYSLPKAGKLSLDVRPGLRARFEPEALETVFRNLLENAFLYASGPPEIRVALSPKGRRAHLVFSDRGRGISKKDRKKIFRMFYRVRWPGETIRGSGLGLAIVRTLVRKHGGKIWVESAGPGGGTAFHIELPLCETPGATEADS